MKNNKNTTLSEQFQHVLSVYMTYYQVCNQINTMGASSGAGTAHSSGAPEFTPSFQWGSCYLIFSFICMFSRSLFVLLYFFFWPLCCLFFFDIRILITSLWYLQTLLHVTCLPYILHMKTTVVTFIFLSINFNGLTYTEMPSDK